LDHSLQSSTYADSIPLALWYHHVVTDGLGYTRTDDWLTDADIPDEWRTEPLLELRSGSKRDVDIVFRLNECVVFIDLSRAGHCKVSVAAKDVATATPVWEALRAGLPKRKKAVDGRIDVGFWYDTYNGPKRAERRIVAPDWDEIADNYSAHTREALGRAMRDFRPSHGGQIILWHGQPGTGKTWALRALCSEWREWCSAEYIVDPDNAFGENPAYLMQLLLSENEAPSSKDAESNWKLLILEDTGELIGEQAKAEAGQGLSRLLNVADGFLGQGLKVLVLITTNEEIKKLHPAVSRPGRAASVVLFEPLGPAEASAWLERHNVAMGSSFVGDRTLADLYSLAEKFPTEPKKQRPVGFALTEPTGLDK
jgi:Domain of unknown function (DUF5925)/ATPase family associated with various cellular activities (AAA)